MLVSLKLATFQPPVYHSTEPSHSTVFNSINHLISLSEKPEDKFDIQIYTQKKKFSQYRHCVQ